jgi:hypothetical protein
MNNSFVVVRDKEQAPDDFVNICACAKGLHLAEDIKIENRYNQMNIKHQIY